jgi:DNA polymerase (family X)
MLFLSMSNLQIAKLLRNIAAAYIIKDENKFRFQIIAYQKAADTIANLTGELKDYYTDNRLDQLPGIGNTLKTHFIDFFKNGQVAQFDWALKDIPKSVFILMDIPSFGPKKSYRLVTEFKLNDPDTVIQDLEKIAKAGKIASLEGFGEKSQSDILRSIEEFRLGKGKTTRMTLPYAFEISEKLLAYFKNIPEVSQANVLGSLRRRAPTVGDIDMSVASDKPSAVLEHFVNYPYIERVIEKGEVSASILVSGGVQVDLLIQPPKSYGSLLQHFTGSKNHNVHLREVALRKGLSLSEYGIKKKAKEGKPKMENFSSEEQFYNAIGLQWIPPELREDQGEIEQASSNTLPKLIDLSDLKGDLHIHSSFPIEPSHDLGQSSIEEMLKRASELGYEYLGFSEHNPSQSKHTNSQIYDLISRRNEAIEHIKSSINDVRIFKMLEVDILPNGELAIDNKSLSLLNGAIVSVHSVFSMRRDEMTKRILEGLSNPKAKILAHPTGRMLNSRNGYEIDYEKIFEFCKTHNKALEINSWPGRLDLTDTAIKMAIDHGVKLVIDSDSHATAQMDMQKYGVFMARRGWATKNDILNTLEYNKFLEWLNT